MVEWTILTLFFTTLLVMLPFEAIGYRLGGFAGLLAMQILVIAAVILLFPSIFGLV